MRNFILTVALAACGCGMAAAADYVPMIREGRVWEYTGSCGVSSDPCHAYHYMKFDGTADVNGTEYHRFVQFKTLTVGDNDGKIRDRRYGDIFVYYLREDEGKVYFLYDSGNGAIVCQDLEAPDGFKADGELKEFKVYDFTLTDGETWNYPHYLEWRVPGGPDETEMQTVRYEAPLAIGGETCRVMSFRNLSVMGSEDLLKFIEGIGTTVNGCLVNPSLGNISGVVNNSMSAGVQSCLNRVFDAEGNVIYAQENASEPPVNDGYVPMIDEGKVWEYQGSYSRQVDGRNEAGLVSHFMKFDGSADVNGKTYSCFMLYKSEYYRGTDVYGELELAETKDCDGPRYFLREDREKVYILTYEDRIFGTDKSIDECFGGAESPEGYGEFLRYDFSLTDGASFNLPSGTVVSSGELIPMTVKIEDAVKVGDCECKTMTFLGENGMSEYPGSVIEGIGPTKDGDLAVFGPPYLAEMPDNSLLPVQGSSLVRVYGRDGKLIYGENPGAGVSAVVSDELSDDATYDVLGRRVRSTVPGSVYIRGGKKFVAK